MFFVSRARTGGVSWHVGHRCWSRRLRMIVLYEREKHLDLEGKYPINVCAHAIYM